MIFAWKINKSSSSQIMKSGCPYSSINIFNVCGTPARLGSKLDFFGLLSFRICSSRLLTDDFLVVESEIPVVDPFIFFKESLISYCF